MKGGSGKEEGRHAVRKSGRVGGDIASGCAGGVGSDLLRTRAGSPVVVLGAAGSGVAAGPVDGVVGSPAGPATGGAITCR